jgi:phosphatidate cytidylyltransferase
VCVALSSRGYQVPDVPLMAGGGLMLVVAYAEGIDALAIATLLTVLCGFGSRMALPGTRPILPDLAVTAFVVIYLPLLASFAMILLAGEDGADRVVVFILAVVLSDTGGYTAGVLFGRHKMAPVVSPKKSWEGLAGSFVFAGAGTAVAAPLLLDLPWWQGALLGAVVVVSGTLGDLTESLIKRDLGLKDMGRLLPEHGGLMDRLDSLLPTAPVVVAFFVLVVGGS